MKRIVVLLPLLSAACMITPPTEVHQPMTTRPVPPARVTAAPTGSIYASVPRPLFEDQRARNLGDIITVSLVEKTSASKASNANASRGSKMDISLPTMTKVPGKFLQGIDVNAANDNSFTGKGAAAANNAFTGTIAVTVIDVYPNGNLLVSGEKQIAINKGEEFIRLSGVINPANVTAFNTVQSTQIADARIEYKGSGYIDEAQTMGWLQRFFLVISPF